jgi:hypothetical protein
MALGPALWEWHQTGKLSGDETARAASVIAVERAATKSLAKWGGSIVPGSFRGNAITGLAILAVDTGWYLYENGVDDSLRSPTFYAHVAIGAGGLMVGLLVGGSIASNVAILVAPIATTWAPVIGGIAGVAATIVIGTTGEYGRRVLVEPITRKATRQQEDSEINFAREELKSKILYVQTVQGP